jgi:hypothetical protein
MKGSLLKSSDRQMEFDYFAVDKQPDQASRHFTVVV